jgi:DNA-binding beta-propeller fold protein YncE
MHTVIHGSIKQRKTICLLLFLLFSLVLSLRLSQSTRPVIAQDNPTAAVDDNFVFMPIVSVYKPPVYLTPQFVATVQLPTALCPGEVGVNPTTGLAYVTNHDSDNVSILKNGALQTTVTTGEWPTLVSSAPDSNKSFVTNLHGGVSYFKGTQLFNTIMPTPAYPGEEVKYGEPYAAAYNPVNGYTYIIHIGGGGYVQVVNDTQTIANIPILEGWILDVKVDPTTGLVYVANWEHGWMVVIQNTSVIQKFRIGWGPDKLGLDATNRYIYAAHSSPNSQYPHNISVTNLDTIR